MSEDFWPDDLITSTDPEPDSPLQILREQASLLEKKTGERVKADVETSSMGDQLVLTFVLLAPALGDYRYSLFKLLQPVDYYPVKLLDWSDEIRELDRLDFPEALREIFSSASTRRVVQELLAYSADADRQVRRVA